MAIYGKIVVLIGDGDEYNPQNFSTMMYNGEIAKRYYYFLNQGMLEENCKIYLKIITDKESEVHIVELRKLN